MNNIAGAVRSDSEKDLLNNSKIINNGGFESAMTVRNTNDESFMDLRSPMQIKNKRTAFLKNTESISTIFVS